MSQILKPFDPSIDGQLFDPTINNVGGALIFFNFSVFEGKVTFPDGDQKIIPAWHWRCVHWLGGNNGEAIWNVLVVPNTANPPSQTMIIEAYLGQTDLPPEDMGSLPRQANVGNPVSTTSGTGIKNDGNGPATSLIEATPSDQAQSSWAMNNDASGNISVLSAGVLRDILRVVRGNSGVGKATITIGDAGDVSITTLHGTADQVPAAGVQAGALGAGVTIPASGVTAGTYPAGTFGYPGIVTVEAGAIGSNGAGRWAAPTLWPSAHGTGTFSGIGYFSGGASGTFTHGLNTTPVLIDAICHVVNSSQTMGYDSENASTVHITAFSNIAWRGRASA